ncbi:MAG: AMP nucleosidase [Chlamydiales bacterium]|nr:AMP nucleosidase [Chlamydiales bacterium]
MEHGHFNHRSGRDLYTSDEARFGEEITEEKFAIETLERYSGSDHKNYQSNLLITNFPEYVNCFARERNLKIDEGTMFRVAHDKNESITMLDFKIGSPAAALVVDLCSFLDIRASLLLGMCGGLRRRYHVGEFLLPVASIRDEGTSDYYFPKEVPALANFLMQRACSEVLEQEEVVYHVGISYTTNMRFWEYKEDFRRKLIETKAQAIEMECATLFSASYRRRLTLGALLLISDLPLDKRKVKTKASSQKIFTNFMPKHIELGIKIIQKAREMQAKRIKGAYHRNVGVYKTKHFPLDED